MSLLDTYPLTAERWQDLESLFGPSGAYSGCWCMYLRESAQEFAANCPKGGRANKARLKAIVDSGTVPGLLGYRRGRAVGWVSVAPRTQYPRLLRSPVHKPVDDIPDVWSVTCFFIHRSQRGEGTATALLQAAIHYAQRSGADLIEGYPVDSRRRRPAAEMWRGSLSLFRRAGFEEVARRKPDRPIVRRWKGPSTENSSSPPL